MIIKGIRDAEVPDEIFKMGLNFQILNADMVATKTHIFHSIYQAKTKNNISKNIWMEILLRASGQKQISNAIKILGAKKGNICVVCEDEKTFEKIKNTVKGCIDDSVLELNSEKEKKIREVFEINLHGNLIERVCEKIALIEVL
ncbi:KEOPS complex Cgi121-like subunit [Methanococcus maripaludis X1]|uniref:KEOPS complex Cgi121-like subunit n=1 Tax=Methanococcus maripaludis X1 TaxID=1053692 RepID=G0H0B6_METMI|nr:KEOPS complex subunit Cgi121 [Methanococcus maripaludis]AEK19997.1 KEOPS complex Cgi121-like subunit [Methanococcus maripaludis X1]